MRFSLLLLRLGSFHQHDICQAESYQYCCEFSLLRWSSSVTILTPFTLVFRTAWNNRCVHQYIEKHCFAERSRWMSPELNCCNVRSCMFLFKTIQQVLAAHINAMDLRVHQAAAKHLQKLADDRSYFRRVNWTQPEQETEANLTLSNHATIHNNKKWLSYLLWSAFW